MTEWWEKAYPGAPMVKVDGFPRPMYPPDAARYGKQPSMDGPDVEAYKRTVSRAGRWPWQPFDDAFSNAFAHGSSGNVKDTGIAGIQRQQGIDDTGWIGKTTFNTLRSIVIPTGLPHAGEMAMDATSVALINDAWDMFEGHEPDESGMTVRRAALNRAVSQIGTAEKPANSNMTKYGAWYGMDGQPWCAMFASWCFEFGAEDINKNSPSFAAGARYAYVPYIVGDAQAGLNGLAMTIDPTPGDLVCYDWNWDGVFDHVGIFEKWSGSNFVCVEGNTSAADYSNGGQVMRQTRSPQSQRTVFVRVAEP